MKSVRELKRTTDEKFSELQKSQKRIAGIEEKIEAARLRKEYESVHRLESQLATARAERDAIRREYNEAQRAEFGVWVPQSRDCTE